MVMFSQVCRILHGVWSIALKTFCTRPGRGWKGGRIEREPARIDPCTA